MPHNWKNQGAQMSRITKAERERFRKIFDKSIDKLNSLKNCKKEHWSKVSTGALLEHLIDENKEL